MFISPSDFSPADARGPGVEACVGQRGGPGGGSGELDDGPHQQEDPQHSLVQGHNYNLDQTCT